MEPRCFKVYCDESRTEGPWRLIGGIWIDASLSSTFEGEFVHATTGQFGLPPGHMKWTKVPPQRTERFMGMYTNLVDQFFKYNRAGAMFFRTIVTDSSYDFSHPLFHGGDYEVGFHKLYYFLILPMLEEGCTYHVRIAERPTDKRISCQTQQSRLKTLMRALNGGAAKRFRQDNPLWVGAPVLSVEPRRARDRVLIQLTDILTGAVGYHFEKRHFRPQAREGKCFLAQYIAEKLGRKTLASVTGAKDRCFNVFRLKPGY